MKTRFLTPFHLSALALLVATPASLAQIVHFQHSGNADPETQGWSIYEQTSGVTFGPIDDNGTPAWSIHDSSTASGTVLIYEHKLNPTEVGFVSSLGWELTSDIRILEAGPNPDLGSTFIEFGFDTRSFLVFLGVQEDGDPVLTPWTSGSTIALENFGSGYHNYTLAYDETSQTVDIAVDGTPVFSDYSGFTVVGFNSGGAGPRVAWGAGSGGLTGQAHFSRVEFTVVPEAHTTLGIAGTLLASIVFRSYLRQAKARLR